MLQLFCQMNMFFIMSSFSSWDSPRLQFCSSSPPCHVFRCQLLLPRGPRGHRAGLLLALMLWLLSLVLPLLDATPHLPAVDG